MASEDFDLLHNFAHDLKTPLGATKGFIELIEASGELNDRQQHFAHRALKAVERMNGIISTLLDFARMGNEMELLIETCDLLEMVEDTANMLESAASEKQVKINIQIQPDAQFVQADAQMLTHVLANLMSNAIKYNRIDGDVYISSEDTHNGILIKVRDTGLGIPKNQQQDVFKQFYRVTKKDHQQIEGTGLGLAIVKAVIEKHGSTISLTSKVNQGSTFSFMLPRATGSSSDHDRELPDDLDDYLQEGREDIEDTDTGIPY